MCRVCGPSDKSSPSARDCAPGGSTTSSSRQHHRRLAHRGRRVAPSPAPGLSGGAQDGSSGALHSPQGTLLRPLHPITDLGGQFDRRGIGRPAHPPGFPPGARFPPAGSLTAQQPQGAASPPARPPQPPLPVGMEVAASAFPADDPLAEACILFLEDRAVGLQRSAMQAVIAAVAAENPAAWSTFRHTQGLPPSGAFRNALRSAVRRMFPVSVIDSDDDEVPGCAQSVPMQPHTQAVSRAQAPRASASGRPNQPRSATSHPVATHHAGHLGGTAPQANPYRAGPGPPALRGGRS